MARSMEPMLTIEVRCKSSVKTKNYSISFAKLVKKPESRQQFFEITTVSLQFKRSCAQRVSEHHKWKSRQCGG